MTSVGPQCPLGHEELTIINIHVFELVGADNEPVGAVDMDMNLAETAAAGEGILVDTGHTCRNGNLGQRSALSEGTGFDDFHVVRDDNHPADDSLPVAIGRGSCTLRNHYGPDILEIFESGVFTINWL